jgi:hypothetical protein
MVYKVNPSVADVSPNIYAAAQQANLNQTQVTQLDQFARTVKLNKNLLRRPLDLARNEFNNLDPQIKEMLQFLYPDASYAKPAPGVGDNLASLGKGVLKVAASPLLGFFKAAGTYGRVLNLPYLVGRQVAQGEDLFSTNVLTDAYDGRKVFDEGALQQAVKDFGADNVQVAKGLLMGLKPGEIVESQGEITEEFLDSFSKAFNNDDSFRQVLDAVKYAQVSPGRDIARIMNKPMKNTPNYISSQTKNVSGFIDFMYQIVVDPLTYLTFGMGKIAPTLARKGWADINIGDRMAKSIAENGPGGVAKVFDSSPLLRKHWDQEIGPEILKLSLAKGTAEKSKQIREIKNKFPGHASDKWILLLERNKIYDSNKAIQYFGNDVDNTLNLIAGRVEGVEFFRTGVATARNQRRLDFGFSRFVDSQLNPAIPTIEVAKKGPDVWKKLTTFGAEVDNFVSPQVNDIMKFSEGLSVKEKVGRLFKKNPMGRSIRIGDEAIDTSDNFRDVALQVLPRDLADFVTVKFVNANADDQVQVLRSLYYAVMKKYGVDGHRNGKEIIEKELQSHFGSAKGAGVVEKIEVPAHLKDVIGSVGARVLPEGIFYESSGVIHPFQEAGAIGSLNYMELAQLSFEAKSKSNLIIASAKGAGQSKFSSNLVNAWTVLTLFPRLGIRSTIDEGIMYLLTAPGRDIVAAFAPKILGGKRTIGKMAAAITGSRKAEGFVGLFKRKTGLPNDADRIPNSVRHKIRKDIAYKNIISEEAVSKAEIVTGITQYARNMVPNNATSREIDLLQQASIHGSGFVTGMANSLVAKASAGGRYGEEVAESLLIPSKLDEALAAANLTSGRKGKLISTEVLEQSKAFNGQPVAGVQYENFGRYFYGNNKAVRGERMIPDSTGNMIPIEIYRRFKPVDAFFSNNALRTEDDFVKAKDELLEILGIYRSKKVTQGSGLALTVTHKIVDPVALKTGTGTLSRTAELRGRGVTDIEIAADLVDRILLDMYTAFHGGANKFNNALLKRLNLSHSRIVADEISLGRKIDDKWNLAAQALDFDEFANLTKGFRPKGRMYTTTEFVDVEGIVDVESAWAKYGNNMMNIMDNQVTGLLRQPALWVTYFRIRDNYQELENIEIKRLMKIRLDDMKINNIKPDVVKYKKKQLSLPRGMGSQSGAYKKSVTHREDALADVTDIVQKKFTEISLSQAADTVLRFVDNPNVRTNFAISVRNVGRFYRATEDFWRRVYRLRTVAPRALYRMRLTHAGMDGYGDLYEDARGDPYLIMPMDDAIFKTVESVSRIFSGTTGFKQPLFNDFTLKLKLANPSFDDESGVPTLSGPIAALSILGMKSILNTMGFKKTAEEIDNFALGGIGENMNFVKAVVPGPLQRIYALLPKSEKDRQEATAAMQAIAFNAARGNIPSANATAEEKYEYLRNIRISAHNIMVMRSVLGLLSPIAPTVQESKDVPDYLKEVGITSVRAEFFDYVNSITKKYGGDVQNPYDMAVASFVGQNPGRLIYTVSRDEKQTNVLISKTKEMKNWYIDNKSLVDKYGEAAFIFAPKTGDFDASSYAWLEAADFIKNKDLDKYYLDVMTSQGKRDYYDIARREKEDLEKTVSPSARRAIITNATFERQSMKASNPFLDAVITGGGFEIASEIIMFEALEQMVQDIAFNIPEASRSKVTVALSQIRNFIQVSQDPALKDTANFADVKRERKASIEALIAELLEGDLIVREANRAVFQTILDYYSRDTYRV